MTTLHTICFNNTFSCEIEDNDLIIKDNKTRSVELTFDCCNHKIMAKCSSLYVGHVPKCIPCKNKNFNYNTNIWECNECKIFYRIEKTKVKYINNFKCHNCYEPDKLENVLYRTLYKKYNIYKTFNLPNKRTCDFYIKTNDKTIVIELDGESHYTTKLGAKSHVLKDKLITEHEDEIILIRISTLLLNSFLKQYKTFIEETLKNETDKILYYNGINEQERNTSIWFYKKISDYAKA